MKNLKKLTGILLALVMMVGFAITANAAETYTLELTNSTLGHSYGAYQIFSGDIQTDNGQTILTNIVWGDGVDVSNFVDALTKSTLQVKTDETTLGSVITTAIASTGNADTKETARAIAEVLSNCISETAYSVSEADLAIEIGELAAANKETATATVNSGTEQSGSYTYTFSNLPAGYYLVIDDDSSVDLDDTADAYSRYMVRLVGDDSIAVKSVIPTVDKKIVETGGDKVSSNTASVGENVKYEITSKVPDHTGYDYYYFIINDTLSSGLDFIDSSVVVKIGNKTLVEGTDYYLYTSTGHTYNGNTYKADTGYTFQIAFADIKNYTKDTAIEVTYLATVNSKAFIGEEGNSNKVNLTYSNNPNNSSRSDNQPGKPDGSVPTGTTADIYTITYLAQIVITKTDESGTAMTDTGFTLTGESTRWIQANGSYYALIEESEKPYTSGDIYYLLTDNTYTKKDPTTAGVDTSLYVTNGSGEYDQYKLVTVNTAQAVTTTVTLYAVSDAYGLVTFSGLGEGVYTIEETLVPSGYNKADNITVAIECKLPDSVSAGTEKCTWEVGSSSTIGVDVTNSTAKYTATIINQRGTSLPTTGGIGTTIFYAVGATLMVIAFVLLITKRRMRKYE